MKKLILMRGVSGSGKSTLARQILAQNAEGVIFSTDDFFMIDGVYRFNFENLGNNHHKNRERTAEAMKQGVSLIIIDNTNTQAQEMKPYVQLADHFGYDVELRSPEPVSFQVLMERQKERETINKSLSAEIVERMLSRFQHNLTVDQIRSFVPVAKPA